jgi:hypothetical protein
VASDANPAKRARHEQPGFPWRGQLRREMHLDPVHLRQQLGQPRYPCISGLAQQQRGR